MYKSGASQKWLYALVLKAFTVPFKQWVRGSNPRRVTNSSQASYRLRRVFYTPHQKLIGLILLLLLSNRNSFRWIRGWLCPEGSSIYTAVTSQ